ncbi:hypothetical protein Tco_1038863 [Tanacetum coccineum]
MKMEILLEPTSNKLMVGDLCDSIRIKLVTTGKKRWCDSIRIKLVPERFYTSAGNPVKEILLKLNLPDHRKLKDGGEGMSMSVQKSQVHKMAKVTRSETKICLVDDLKVFKITISLTSQDKGTSSCLKSKDTTTYSQDKRHEVYELKTKDKA